MTLYHGSLRELTPNNERGRLYLSPFVAVANEYIICQADNAEGEYGHIYTVEINDNDIVFTDDIDQNARVEGILHCIDDNYYRIDLPENHQFRELTQHEIDALL